MHFVRACDPPDQRGYRVPNSGKYVMLGVHGVWRFTVVCGGLR